jgi:hypothetical protein
MPQWGREADKTTARFPNVHFRRLGRVGKGTREEASHGEPGGVFCRFVSLPRATR